MRFSIISKGDALSNSLSGKMRGYLHDFDMVYDEEEPDIVISVGGDGTLLHAFHLYSSRLDKTAFVGVHTGHLGFYADWVPEEIEKLVIAIAKTEHEIIEYPLLNIKVTYGHGGKETTYLALNESTIKGKGGTLVVDIDINNDHFEGFRGDGICVSTPSGSTAYNKALGGAIIHPSLHSIQFAEMASINNRVFRTIGSPLILPEHHTLKIKPVNTKDFDVTVDHLSVLHKDVATIEFKVAQEKVRFARFRPFPFWKRVHDSFISDGRRNR